MLYELMYIGAHIYVYILLTNLTHEHYGISIDIGSIGGIDVYHMIDRTLGTLGGIVIYVCDGSDSSRF